MHDSPYSPTSPRGMEMSPRYWRGVERMIRRKEAEEAARKVIPVSLVTQTCWATADAEALAR